MLEATKQLGVPDVFHVHDWQAAMVPVYLRTVYAGDPVLRGAAVVLTIHNAGYQGKFPPVTTERLLLPWEIFTMDKLEQFDRFNFLKGGLVYSDILTTVSRKYAEEIQTAEFGEQLDTVLRGAGGGSARDFERRGLREVGPGDGWEPGGALHGGGFDGQGDMPRGFAACVWIGESGGCDAGDRDRVAVCDAEGLRPGAADCRAVV